MPKNEEKENREKVLEEYANKAENVKESTSNIEDKIGPEIEMPDVKLPQQRIAETKMSMSNNIGWIPLKIEEFPTRGLFYPPGTEVTIRAANGGEIRHWSTLQEDDFSALDDMLNYILERCITIKAAGVEAAHLSWKDIKEVDRFYILLAVHELTFANGENKLQVNISENKKVDVTKDMISYITLDPKLMKYYNDQERCFVLKLKNKNIIKLDIPTVGVTQWIKKYLIRKRQAQEPFDEDYITFAPFVIRNWRGLSDDIYSQFAQESLNWDVTTISLMVHFKKIFADTINPVIRYVDEGGVEHEAPLNFQGGIKSLFLISDPFRELE